MTPIPARRRPLAVGTLLRLVAASLASLPAHAAPPTAAPPTAAPPTAAAPPSASLRPPEQVYGAFYGRVELAGLFPDSKTFPDMVPLVPPARVLAAWRAARGRPGFDLAAFVRAHFQGPLPPGPAVPTAAPGEPLDRYLRGIWPVLTEDESTAPRWSSLVTLPEPAVVPGGRFRETYCWDSYFIMLGLEADGERARAAAILADIESEIDRFGHVPNGNRTYYLSRSQPPVFALMVDLVAADGGGDATYRAALPRLLREWRYWTDDEVALPPGRARRCAVRLADGDRLSRYYDTRDTPRDESYAEDVRTAGASPAPGPLWRNLRAAAASGWDYSSRWFADRRSLRTTRTLDMVPPDLNAFLVQLATTIAHAETVAGDPAAAALFRARAAALAGAIRRDLFDPARGAFVDGLRRRDGRSTELTAATVVPLFAGVATAAEAEAVGRTVEARLLRPGGLVTTDIDSGQQWDAPNGWAPLQWMAVVGLRRYGMDALAREIATRWVGEVVASYRRWGLVFEKYDVEADRPAIGGGGEYATQIGFGWTNGVLLALGALYPDLGAEIRSATHAGAPAAPPVPDRPAAPAPSPSPP